MRGSGRALRIGVLGCADIAWRMALPAMRRVDDVEVVAVASRDLAKAERFARHFGGEPVEGYARLLDRRDVDAVYIALPTGLHHTWTRRSLEAGKHAFVEKSFSTTRAEARDAIAMARSTGLWVAENFAFVHHSQHGAVRSLIESGAIGEPQLFTGEFGIPPRNPNDIRYRAELGGGALLDVGAYPLRAAQMYLGPHGRVLGSVLRVDQERGIDLGGSTLLCSDDGIAAQLSFSFEASYRSTYSVWGSAGRIALQRAFSVPTTLCTTLRLEGQDRAEDIVLPADDQFANCIANFARLVRDDADPGPHMEILLSQADLLERIRVGAHLTCVPSALPPIRSSRDFKTEIGRDRRRHGPAEPPAPGY